MIMLTCKRSDLVKIDKVFPLAPFTADSNYCYFMLTDKQYKYSKDILPDHVKYKLPKAKPQDKSNLPTLKIVKP